MLRQDKEASIAFPKWKIKRISVCDVNTQETLIRPEYRTGWNGRTFLVLCVFVFEQNERDVRSLAGLDDVTGRAHACVPEPFGRAAERVVPIRFASRFFWRCRRRWSESDGFQSRRDVPKSTEFGRSDSKLHAFF